MLDPTGSPALWAEHDQFQTSFYSNSYYLQAFDLLQSPLIARTIADGQERSVAIRMQRNSASVLGALSVPPRIFGLVAARIFELNPKVRFVTSDLLERDRLFEKDESVYIVGRGDDLRRGLPQTMADFDSSLTKDHLKRLKYSERRFFRDFPDSSVVVLEQKGITAEIFKTIVDFNRARMAGKRQESGIDAVYEHRMLQVARTSGMVILLRNGPEICAGSVLLTAGKDVFLWAISHDARYDKFSPGLVCLYGGIKHLIGSGFLRYHFLWGDSAYKRQLGASPTELASYAIVRPGASSWVVAPLLYDRFKRDLHSFLAKKLMDIRKTRADRIFSAIPFLRRRMSP